MVKKTKKTWIDIQFIPTISYINSPLPLPLPLLLLLPLPLPCRARVCACYSVCCVSFHTPVLIDDVIAVAGVGTVDGTVNGTVRISLSLAEFLRGVAQPEPEPPMF